MDVHKLYRFLRVSVSTPVWCIRAFWITSHVSASNFSTAALSSSSFILFTSATWEINSQLIIHYPTTRCSVQKACFTMTKPEGWEDRAINHMNMMKKSGWVKADGTGHAQATVSSTPFPASADAPPPMAYVRTGVREWTSLIWTRAFSRQRASLIDIFLNCKLSRNACSAMWLNFFPSRKIMDKLSFVLQASLQSKRWTKLWVQNPKHLRSHSHHRHHQLHPRTKGQRLPQLYWPSGLTLLWIL